MIIISLTCNTLLPLCPLLTRIPLDAGAETEAVLTDRFVVDDAGVVVAGEEEVMVVVVVMVAGAFDLGALIGVVIMMTGFASSAFGANEERVGVLPMDEVFVEEEEE